MGVSIKIKKYNGKEYSYQEYMETNGNEFKWVEINHDCPYCGISHSHKYHEVIPGNHEYECDNCQNTIQITKGAFKNKRVFIDPAELPQIINHLERMENIRIFAKENTVLNISRYLTKIHPLSRLTGLVAIGWLLLTPLLYYFSILSVPLIENSYMVIGLTLILSTLAIIWYETRLRDRLSKIESAPNLWDLIRYKDIYLSN